MAAQIADMIGVHPERDERGYFKGISKLAKMGNNAPIAFGGCLMAGCISAAFASLPASPDYELYSVLGNFLGPGSIEVYPKYEVEDIRTTKTFATRKVVAWQDLGELPAESKTKRPPKGQGLRRAMIMLVDFQVREKATFFDYSPLPIYAQPSTKQTYGKNSRFNEHRSADEFRDAVEPFYRSPNASIPHKDYLEKNFPEKTVQAYEKMFPLFARFFSSRPVERTVATQTMMGLEAHRDTSQDAEPIQRRTNSLWWKGRDDMDFSKRGVNEASLAFLMDGALAFLPLTFTHRFLNAVAAVSSLEFSLRFMTPPDMTRWHLSEQNTESGQHGRTYSTGRMWDENGRLVAVMTQMSIMRPFPEDAKKPSKL